MVTERGCNFILQILQTLPFPTNCTVVHDTTAITQMTCKIISVSVTTTGTFLGSAQSFFFLHKSSFDLAKEWVDWNDCLWHREGKLSHRLCIILVNMLIIFKESGDIFASDTLDFQCNFWAVKPQLFLSNTYKQTYPYSVVSLLQ